MQYTAQENALNGRKAIYRKKKESCFAARALHFIAEIADEAYSSMSLKMTAEAFFVPTNAKKNGGDIRTITAQARE